MLLTLIRNLRSAGRQYLREPLMYSVAIVSLAIAMGAGTYLFGCVNLVLLTPPPGLQQAERLVDVGLQDGFLFGLNAFDATAFLVATLLLLGIGLCALAIPARRVLCIEPQAALPYE